VNEICEVNELDPFVSNVYIRPKQWVWVYGFTIHNFSNSTFIKCKI